MSKKGYKSHREDDEEEMPGVPATEHRAMNLFFQRYLPASGFKDATELLTTDDIINELWLHGCGIGRDELYNWMVQQGYKDDFLEGMKMVWLLKRSED